LDISKPKPSPEALIRCVEVLGLDMCECLIAGDSILDVRAGKAAGAKNSRGAIWSVRSSGTGEGMPNLVLPDITALPSYIE